MKKNEVLLYPLSIVYNLITTLRNFLFDIGLINSVQYKIPTIGVGNLSTGGTGKSMLVDYLIELLKIKYSLTTLSRDTKGIQVVLFKLPQNLRHMRLEMNPSILFKTSRN